MTRFPNPFERMMREATSTTTSRLQCRAETLQKLLKEPPNETYFIKNTMPKYIGKAVFRPKEPKMTDEETAALTKCPHSQCFCTGKCKYGPTYDAQYAINKYKADQAQENASFAMKELGKTVCIGKNNSPEFKCKCGKCEIPIYSEGDEITVKLNTKLANGLSKNFENDKVSFWFSTEDIISYKPAPKPVTVKRWVNINESPQLDNLFHTRADANDCSKRDRIACVEIEITYTPGEGL